MQRTSDPTLAASLAKDLFVGRTMQFQADLEQKIKELTPEVVNAALRKHLDPKRLSTSPRAISKEVEPRARVSKLFARADPDVTPVDCSLPSSHVICAPVSTTCASRGLMSVDPPRH